MMMIRTSKKLLMSSRKNLALNCANKKIANVLGCEYNRKNMYSCFQSVRLMSTALENYKNPEYNYSSLSELQSKSCELFKDKKLFGTRNGSKFDWMTYGEFGKEVDKFRWVLTHHRIGIFIK